MRVWPAFLLVLTIFSGCVGPDNSPVDDAAEDAAGLSKVVYDTILQEQYRIRAEMDGIDLVVDVFRPDTDEPVPIILVQSPYWAFLGDAKDNARPTWYIDYFVPRGYAVALGEMRGTRDSGGCWDFGGPRDQQDGYDMVEGLAAKPWSNGNVGMLGQSHVGMSQVAAGVTDPPSLKTIVPIAAVTDWYRYLHYEGAPYVLNRATPPAYFAVHASPSTPEQGPENTPIEWALTQAQTACPDNAVHLSQSAELDGDKDSYWQERDLIAKAGNTRAAVFLVHGFLDENVKTDHFLDYWEDLPEDTPKKAWFGQWYHEHPSYYEWRDDLHRWYDYHLKGIENGIMTEPTVTVQDNRLVNRTEPNWPVGVQTQILGLEPDQSLQLGRSEQEPADLGYLQQPTDDRGQVVNGRIADHLAFLTAPMRQTHMAGVAELNLSVDALAVDMRLIAVMFDVDPAGNRDEISRAYLDARHRNGPDTNEDLPLGTQMYHLKFYPRDHVIEDGHRLELVLMGGDQGCQAALPSTYGTTCEGTGILPVADSHVIFAKVGKREGSQLLLPVVENAGPERVLTPLAEWLDDLPE